MNTFETRFKAESSKTVTENGQDCLGSTGMEVLNFYAMVGALRNETDRERITSLFDAAYAISPILAMKIIFYARDIREGLGERRVFRVLINHAAKTHPDAVRKNIELISLYGRFDDLYFLMGTPVEDDMWKYVKRQLKADLKNMKNNKPVSLLAKWLKTADASSNLTRQLGILTALKLGYTVYRYKRIVRSLRKYINVTETLMSSNQWSAIDYGSVPSRAMTIYRNAFERHDFDRFDKYLEGVKSGSEKINALTLYPYDIIRPYIVNHEDTDKVLEAQWKALPNYVSDGATAIVMADLSGSMMCNGQLPLLTAMSLAIYFAERSKGPYHDLWMSFSSHPNIHRLHGANLHDRLWNLDRSDWGNDTNIEAAFDKILNIAITSGASNEDLPDSLVIISDMEFNRCLDTSPEDWTFYGQMEAKYARHGYRLPNIIFWNVNSHSNIFHVDANHKGVQLASGSSPTVFKQVVTCIGLSPVEAMNKVLSSDRYAPVRV